MMKQHWDKNLTPAENLTALGLDPDPNSAIKQIKKKPQSAFVGHFTLPERDPNDNDKSFADKNPKRRKMSEADQMYALACIVKHGVDYKAMERDIKTNYNQLSENQIKKMCEKLKALDSEQCLVDRTVISS
jgi:hypothetical protein